MLKLKINLDPKLPRVIIIASLLMLVHIFTKLVEILSTQRQPTEIELELFICEGVLILLVYLLTFLQKEET
jgi:hypothetical protein